MNQVTLLIMLACLAGCATAGRINGLQVGMTKEDVVSLMGEPVSVSAKSGTEYLNYKLSETGDDAFRGWTSPYYVRLVDGKVDSYGRSGDFDSTKTPTIRIENEESVKGDGKKDMYVELKKLGELKNEGIITEAEFQEKKKYILNNY